MVISDRRCFADTAEEVKGVLTRPLIKLFNTVQGDRQLAYAYVCATSNYYYLAISTLGFSGIRVAYLAALLLYIFHSAFRFPGQLLQRLLVLDPCATLRSYVLINMNIEKASVGERRKFLRRVKY